MASSDSLEAGKDTRTWIYYGVGPGVFGSHTGLSIGGGVCHQREEHIFLVRLTQVREFEISFGGPTIPAEEVLGLAVLYGVSKRIGSRVNSLAIGLSITRRTRRGARLNPLLGSDYEEIRTYSPGIPIDSQLFITPLSKFGFGIDLFYDLNTRDSSGGLLLSLQFGDI